MKRRGGQCSLQQTPVYYIKSALLISIKGHESQLTHRNARPISSFAIRSCRGMLPASSTSRILKGVPSFTISRRRIEVTMGSAHHTAELTESARQSSKGTYHCELTPSRTATRGYFELLGTLFRRSRLGAPSLAAFVSSPGLKAPAAVFAASV